MKRHGTSQERHTNTGIEDEREHECRTLLIITEKWKKEKEKFIITLFEEAISCHTETQLEASTNMPNLKKYIFGNLFL